MATITQHAPGTFCWAEMGSTDAAAAKKFYTGLFGWEAVDMPMGDSFVYTMLRKDGKDVGALYGLMKDQMDMGIPSHWMNYVASENVDETAAKIKGNGGTIVMEPMDVMDSGRMVVAKDPQGATFGAWQSKNHTGAGVIDEPNAVCWNELLTNDAKGAATFYAGVFGWTTEPFGGDYTLFKHPAKAAGGMMVIQKEWGPMPPSWAVYFAVENADKTIAKAKDLGAKIVMPAKEVPTVGRFALLADPTGGHFYILQPA